MGLFYSVIKRQLALLSPGWVSVKCITKNVKRGRFEVNKLHKCHQLLSGLRSPERGLPLPVGTQSQHFLNRFTDTRKMENGTRKNNLQLSTESHRTGRRGGGGETWRWTPFRRWDEPHAVYTGQFQSCHFNPSLSAVASAPFYGHALPTWNLKQH